MGPTCHKIAITKKNRILLGIFHELKKLRFKHVSQFHFLFCLKSIWWCQKCQSQCSKNEWLAKWWYHIFSFYFPNDWGVGMIPNLTTKHIFWRMVFFRLNHQLGWRTVMSWPWVWTWWIRNWRSLFGRPVDFARWEVRLSAVGLGLGGVRLGPEKVSAWVGWNLGWQRWFCLGFLIRLGLRLVGRLVVWIMNSFRILGSAWINQSGRSLDLIQTCFATKIKSRMLTKYTNEIHRPKYSRNV